MLAEAAAAAGIPFTQSTMSNMAMEDGSAGLDLRHWWQLYVFGPPEIREALIARAERAGCEALVVTTDAQIYGNRAWARHYFTRPGHLTWSAMLDAARHPRWLAATMVRRRGMPAFENIIDFVPQEKRKRSLGTLLSRGGMNVLGQLRARCLELAVWTAFRTTRRAGIGGLRF